MAGGCALSFKMSVGREGEVAEGAEYMLEESLPSDFSVSSMPLPVRRSSYDL